MSKLFTSSGQRIGASASASVCPVNIQDCFPLGFTDLISSQCKGFSRVFFNTVVQKHQFFDTQHTLLSLLYGPTFTSICNYWKNHSFDYTDFCWQSDGSAGLLLLLLLLSRFSRVRLCVT